MDKTSVIFGNEIDAGTVKKAAAKKANYVKKYGDDSGKDYRFDLRGIDCLSFMDAENMVLGKGSALPENSLIVGNIRMGFGHYRISMAMASCARALGYRPLWLDLAGLDSTGSKMIREQNDMYSLGSRISQKSKLFNALVWEPMNKEGFKKLTYNAIDQKNSELLVPLFKSIPKDTPYIATHVWPAQAAVHAGMTHVVNAIPDNWPMALHLAEGSIHTVQTSFAYNGYKMLDGFAKKPLKGMSAGELKMVGHYVDHELVSNVEADNIARRERLQSGKPVRILFTVGGAGAGMEQFLAMLRHLIPYVKSGKATLFLNFGDHLTVYNTICSKLKFPHKTYFDEYEKLLSIADEGGIHCICNKDIFRAVYSTNLLMRSCDLLVTKPSELAFYPVPKLFMRHIGGHEVYGGIHSQELGDGIKECPTSASINLMLDRLLSDRDIIVEMTHRIDALKAAGVYDGAYECVRLACQK